MLIFRGEAWLDAGQPSRSDPPNRDKVVGPLAANVQFQQRAEILPEELLATAHAASYCLSLWKQLEKAGHFPTRVRTVAYVHQDANLANRREREVFLDAIAEIPGLNEQTLARHAKAAKSDFIALRGLSGVSVNVDSHLDG